MERSQKKKKKKEMEDRSKQGYRVAMQFSTQGCE